MKSKKMLAQIAAFSLVFGMTGVVSSWADDIILDGTNVTFKDNAIGLVKNEDGSFTVSNQDVKGVCLQNGSNLTANHVNFINGGDGFSEISVDDKSTLTVNGGSLDSGQDAFNVNDGSKAEVNEAKVTTGAWANNAAITLKNSTTSGNWLYAGNAFPDPEDENDKGPVKEGLPVGSITIDGGTASVKNVLVQNKGQFNVTNGAVLDVTKDTSATDSAWEQPATGIMKGGEIVVRAWGPNTAQAEKGNSDTDPVNKLDQVSTLAVNGATVKANKLTVEGKEAKELNYSESAAFTAKNSKVELGSATLNSAKFYAENSQISIGDLHAENSQMSVKGDLNVSGRMEFYGGTFSADALQVKADKEAFQIIRFCDGAKAEIKEFSSDGVILDINTSDYDISKGQGADVTIQKIALSNESEIQLEKGSLHSDTVKLDTKAQLFANNGTKAEIQKMTMDNGSRLDVGSYDDDDMVVKEAADVTVHQLDMKGNSTITIENGKLNSDQITMDKSTIDIAGVGTLIANKMTLNNTKLSLNGIQNEVTTLALDADEDIQPLDVTQNNGVTVEVKDTLDMNGSTLRVKDGSKLITNQMKLANGSTVTVDGTNSSYTIKGTDNTVSGDAKIEATNGGSVTLAEGAGIKAEAGTDNKVKTIITADSSSTVDVTKGSLYIANAKKGDTGYDVSTAIIKNGTENKGNEFKHIYGDSRFVIAQKDADGNYTFKSNIAEISKGSLFSHILEEAYENEGKPKDFVVKAFGPDTPDDAQGINAFEHAAAIAEMAGVTHGTYGFAQDFSGVIADHKGEGSGIWANYLRQDKKVDGFQVAGRKAKYDVKYNGFLIGSDLISDENSRTGIAFAYADGSHTEKDGVTGKNDTKYYGGDVYHHFTAGGIQYKADIGFIKSDNDLEQTQPGTTIKGSVDGNAFFAGIRAEKEIALGASSLTPYAGLRYYRIHTGDFTDSLGMKHETENANLWNLPVGVEFRHEVKNGSWSLTPVAEIGYNFAMGDKDTKETVSLGNAADTFSFDIGESAFLARLGVEAENSTWTLGGGYRYQKGSDTQSNQWYIQAGYRF
ncbi:MAG: autotransporter domain-containing protein [Dialister sp.]|nr:autotransporter domain-containing protein [Dialister sp.]